MPISRALFVCLLCSLGSLQLGGCASSPESRSPGQYIDDSALTARVKTALVREAGFSEAMDVHVNVNRGVVQLAGFVDSDELKRRAEEVAKSVTGVQSVKNDLRVAQAR